MGRTIIGDIRMWNDEEGLSNIWQYLAKIYFNYKINSTDNALNLPYVSVRELH
jgi:arginine/ornithine N-succinyltransferase beta subunit